MAASSSSSTSEPGVPPLAKYLASNEKKVRDKAVQNLASFLSTSTEDALPPPEMRKLWKGIFYSFWMSDKPLVQQALASELAELVLTIPTASLALDFLKGFWEAIVREWNSIDRLRMDKYYMLVRRFINASHRLLLRHNWDPVILEEYNTLLIRSSGGPLCPDHIRTPAGLSYHICEVYFEELDKVLATDPTPNAKPNPKNSKKSSEPSSSSDSSSGPAPAPAPAPPAPAPLGTFLEPFLQLAARTNNSTTYKQVQSSVFEPLLHALQPPEEDSDHDDRRAGNRRKRPRSSLPTYPNLLENACLEASTGKDGSSNKLTRGQLRKGISKQMFDVASKEETRDVNRRRMYAICKSGLDEDSEDDES